MTNRKTGSAVLWTLSAALLLSGCGPVGSKTGSVIMIYGAAAVLSLILPIGYCAWIRKRNLWALLLFASVLVVNAGYFALALSGTLEEALLANRIAYLGAVFLPLSILMILLHVTRLQYRRWLPPLLLTVSILIFLIAASPGYLDIYYKSVHLIHVNGVAVLQKEYGPWHSIYLFYLLGYFSVMVAVVIYANIRRKPDSRIHAVILTFAVFVNIGVWLLEQLVQLDFELLSVSYIVSEAFLIGLYLMQQETESQLAAAAVPPEQSERPKSPPPENLPSASDTALQDRCKRLEACLPQLTPTEHSIYSLYVEGLGTRQVLETMNIKENTLKYHNKNIYSKLEVSSRKELLELARELHRLQNTGGE